jgi:hypothetical protein
MPDVPILQILRRMLYTSRHSLCAGITTRGDRHLERESARRSVSRHDTAAGLEHNWAGLGFSPHAKWVSASVRQLDLSTLAALVTAGLLPGV